MGKNQTGGDFCGGFPQDIAQHLAPQCEYMRAKQSTITELPGAGHLSDRRAVGASSDPLLHQELLRNNPYACE
jgi:hypothetical protein